MSGAGVPVIPGTTDPVTTAEELVRLGDEYGWPLAVKASAGGGGKGLKVVESAEEAERALASAQREGEAYFSDATVYVEKLIRDPRHVEVQVLADSHGTRDPPGRARLHDPAPPPEARRGDAVPGGRCRSARADRPDRRRRRARRRLPQRGDDRGPPRSRRQLLLPRDEHADPGRAHRHRARHRDRPRARADPHRGGRAAVRRGRRTSRFRGPRDRMPHQRRGRGQRVPPGAGDDHGVPRAGRARACASIRASRRARRSWRSTTRWSRSSASGTRTASARGCACCGRSRSSWSRASRR